MPQHDHHGKRKEVPTGQFNGDDIEFAPFMFEPTSQPVDTVTGEFGEADMEFEPFMFDQGQVFNPGQAAMASPDLSETPAVPAPLEPVHQMEAEPAVSQMEAAPAAESLSPVDAPTVSPAAEADLQAAPSEAESASFAGHEVPMPSAFMQSPAVQEEPAATPVAAADSSISSGPVSEAPADADGLAASVVPVAPEMTAQESTEQPVLNTEPAVTGDITPVNTEPQAQSTEMEPDLRPSPSAPPPSMFAGMPGRTRGNTGPLSSTLPNGSWSDSSLASIEDFSSVLVAIQAGKRLRQSGPLAGTLLSPTTLPGAAAAATSAPASGSNTAGPDPAMPEWAAQAVVGLTGMAPAATSGGDPAQLGAATAWPNAGQWEPDLPSGATWPGPDGSQAAPSDQQLLPRWSMDPSAGPPDATSWTGAQPQTRQAPAEPAQEPTSPAPPVTPPVQAFPVSGAMPVPTQERMARDAMASLPTLDGSSLSETLGGLEPGVAGMLTNVNSPASLSGVSGEDIEFDSFMFDQGVPAPLPVLSSADPTAMASLPQDLGPTFDPMQYANPVQTEETHEYGDLDAEYGRSLIDAAQEKMPSGPLPFWLQDPAQRAAQLAAIPDETAQENLMHQRGQYDPTGTSSDSAPSEADFAELPPIDPFDFSMLAEGQQDEGFGFNLDELSGSMMENRDPMVVTANLEALADLLGGHGGHGPDARTLRQAGIGNIDMTPAPAPASKPHTPPPSAVTAGAVDAVDAVDAAAEPMPGAAETTQPAAAGSSVAHTASGSPAAGKAAEDTSGGWMATDTTNLSSDSVSALMGNLDGTAAPAEMAVEDIDVAPFDYSELELEVEPEAPTGLLEHGSSLEGPLTGKLATKTEQLQSKAAPDEPEEVWGEADGDTSLFTALPAEAQAEEAEMPTGYLREEQPAQSTGEHKTGQLPEMDDAGYLGDGVPESAMAGPAIKANAPAPAPSSPDFVPAPDMVDEAAASGLAAAGVEGEGAPVFRARVARGAWGDPALSTTPGAVEKPHHHSADAPIPGWSATPTAALVTPGPLAQEPVAQEPVAQEPVAQEPVVQTPPAGQDALSQVHFEQDNTQKMAAHTDATPSGPLPSLGGFEDLNSWVERYPQDMGAHMALASAYVQAGEVETALRVYRRMIRKPSATPNVLRMIQDELADLEDQARQYPRYYQLKGDLLIRQGHGREAIDEYNKLG